jgi:hypothetical protein
MFFLLFNLYDRRIGIREAQKHKDPTDPDPDSDPVPDPQHWIGNDGLTLTAERTTAALAWASRGVIRSQMDCASRSSFGV